MASVELVSPRRVDGLQKDRETAEQRLARYAIVQGLKIARNGRGTGPASTRVLPRPRSSGRGSKGDIEAADVGRGQALDAVRIARKRVRERLKIFRTQALPKAEIASRKEIERAEIACKRGLKATGIARERNRHKLEIKRKREVMEKATALSHASFAQAASGIQADIPRAKVIDARERAQTVRESEVAKRCRLVDLTIAEDLAEEKRMAAEAERGRAVVEVEAQRRPREAEAILADPACFSLFRRRLLDRLAGLVSAAVKPMEPISTLRIVQGDGLNGGDGDGRAHRSASDEVIASALRSHLQAPLTDKLFFDIGIEGGTVAPRGGPARCGTCRGPPRRLHANAGRPAALAPVRQPARKRLQETASR